MATLKLRSPEDVTRLFSALADVQLTHESGALSLSELEIASLEGESSFDFMPGLLLTGIVGLIAGWVAVKGYERNQGSVGHGAVWGSIGMLFPIPALVYTAVVD